MQKYFNVPYSALFSTQYFSTLILYRRSLDSFYASLIWEFMSPVNYTEDGATVPVSKQPHALIRMYHLLMPLSRFYNASFWLHSWHDVPNWRTLSGFFCGILCNYFTQWFLIQIFHVHTTSRSQIVPSATSILMSPVSYWKGWLKKVH